MKKLAYLLILSLCLNGVAGATSTWSQTAQAETKSEKASVKSEKKKSSNTDSEKKESTKKSDKTKADEKKTAKDSKKTKVKKEKEYTLDLAGNNQVALSVVLEYAKLGIKLKEVKSIEYEDKKDKKLISWKLDEENEGDYIITVLKDFEEVRLRIVTKKTSKLLVLLNGAKMAQPEQETVTEAASTFDPTETVSEPQPTDPGDNLEAESQALLLETESVQPEQTPETTDAKPADETPAAESVEAPRETPTEQTAEAPEETPSEDPESEQGREGAEAEEQTESGIEGEAPEATDVAETEVAALAMEPEEPAEPSQEAQAPEESKDTPEESRDVNFDNTDLVTALQGGNDAESVSPETQESTDQPQDEGAQGQGEAAEPPAEGSQTQEPTPEGQDATTEEPSEPEQEEGGTGEDGPEEGGSDETTDPQTETGAQIPSEAEAWFKRGSELQWGTLEEIVGKLIGGETVYIQSGNIMLVSAAPLAVLSTVTLLPDKDVFKGSYSVCISMENPTGVAEPSLLQPEQLLSIGERADLYIWVVQDTTTPTGEDEEEKPTLTVTATGLEESGWTRTQPQFTLSGIPDGKNWTYAAIIYDERIVPIGADIYTPEEEGVYTLRFAMLDELGDIMAASEQYSLQLDWTAPEVSIEVDEETSFTLEISASDNVSGLDSVSIDKGKTWNSIEEGSYTVTETAEKTFATGDIQVRDIAGNVYQSEEEYTVTEVEGEEEGEEGEEEGEDGGGGGGGGGNGNGSGTPRLPHASGDGEEGADYDALAMELPDEPMYQLTVGGETMDLTLLLASAQAPNASVGTYQPFSARLKHWKDASNSDAPNTLVLEAEIDEDLGDVFSYEWHFNGEVYRMLANSGIKYVALKVDDAVAAFPTEGFTGGTRYTELKMQGVSTRRFDYTLTMKLNLDPNHVSAMTESDYSQNCDLSIHATVEDKNYELSNSPQSMMYFYNVFVGAEDMMDQPFGEYDATA